MRTVLGYTAEIPTTRCFIVTLPLYFKTKPANDPALRGKKLNFAQRESALAKNSRLLSNAIILHIRCSSRCVANPSMNMATQ